MLGSVRQPVSGGQLQLLSPYLPRTAPEGGHPWAEHRPILNGLFWKLGTGAPWRDIPERYGPWNTIYYLVLVHLAIVQRYLRLLAPEVAIR